MAEDAFEVETTDFRGGVDITVVKHAEMLKLEFKDSKTDMHVLESLYLCRGGSLLQPLASYEGKTLEQVRADFAECNAIVW